MHAVGACSKLQVLQHSAYEAAPAHLCCYGHLQSLSEVLGQARPTQGSFMAQLTPLTRLQHLRLDQCVLLGCCIP